MECILKGVCVNERAEKAVQGIFECDSVTMAVSLSLSLSLSLCLSLELPGRCEYNQAEVAREEIPGEHADRCGETNQ